MTRLAIIAGILAAAAPLGIAQSSNWIADPAHSEVDFAVKHLAIANVHGKFGNVEAELHLDQSDLSKSTVKATINVSGVDTGEAPRDNDLKTARFFDTAQFASATFTSTSVEKSPAGLSVTGNLTLHGVTRPVTLMVEGPNGPVQGTDHKQHMGFSATTMISRTDFGIGTGVPSSIVSDAVIITIDLDVTKQ